VILRPHWLIPGGALYTSFMTVTLPEIEERIRIEGGTFEFRDIIQLMEYRHQKAQEALMAAIHNVVDASTDGSGEGQRNMLLLALSRRISHSVEMSIRSPTLMHLLMTKEG